MFELPKNKLKIICISHAKDVDGFVCAALIKSVKESNYLLANYGDINDCLKSIDGKYTSVYVCDLAISETMVDEFARIRQFSNLTYIDHHIIDIKINNILRKLGINVVHNRLDCASVLTYNLFKTNLSREAGLLAVYAAISDGLENGPLARKLFRRYDRAFIMFETTLLSNAIEKANIEYKKKIVEELCKFEYPHRVPGLSELALEHAERVAALRVELPNRIQRIGKVFYASAEEDPTETIANLLVDLYDAPISVSYHINEKIQTSDLSIRGSVSSRINLGKRVYKLARKFEGTGGGHAKTCGATIPTSKLMEFIQALSLSK
jgi:nanoRNase/pAp phosphatase (c-di-AMP/oligoRNAs hydrolase)